MRGVLGVCVVALAAGCSLILPGDESDAGPIDDGGSDVRADGGTFNNNYEEPYNCDPQTMALYHFNGGTIDICDPTLSLTNLMPAFEPAEGNFGSAASFTGMANVLKSEQSPDANWGTELTVEAWVRAKNDVAPDNARLYIVTSSGLRDLAGQRRYRVFLFGQNSSWILRAEVADKQCDALTMGEGGVLTDSEWHHVAVTIEEDAFENVTLNFFIDGEHQSTVAPATVAGTCGEDNENAHLMIGGLVSIAEPNVAVGTFDHAIDEVRVSRAIRFRPETAR